MRFNSLHPDIIVEIIKIRDFTHNFKDEKLIEVKNNGDIYCHQTTDLNGEYKLYIKKKLFDLFDFVHWKIDQKYMNICCQRLIKYLHSHFSLNYFSLNDKNFTNDNNLIISLYTKHPNGVVDIRYNVIPKYRDTLNILFCIKNMKLILIGYYGEYEYIDKIIKNTLFNYKSSQIIHYIYDYRDYRIGRLFDGKIDIYSYFNNKYQNNINLFDVSRKYFI